PQLVGQRRQELVLHVRGAFGFRASLALAFEQLVSLILGPLLLRDVARDRQQFRDATALVPNRRDQNVPPLRRSSRCRAEPLKPALAIRTASASAVLARAPF